MKKPEIKNQEGIVIPTVMKVKDFEIHRIKLIDIGKLKGRIGQIMQIFAEDKDGKLAGSDEKGAMAYVLGFLPILLGDTPEAIAEILELSTNKKKEEILNTDLDIVLKVCEAVIEANQGVFHSFFGVKKRVEMIREKVKPTERKDLEK